MQNSINEEIVHINGQPQKLVICLHGYIDNADYLEKSLSPLIENLDNVAIHLPQAPLSCEVLDDKRQWYSMHRFDPNDERKTVTSMDECVNIYDKMTSGLEEARTYLDDYIDQCLNEYQLEDKDLYLCGFSQGAMLAIHTALMRDNPMAGCVSFSGIMAAHSYLEKNHLSHPDMCLIHGNNDNLVRFEALDFTKQNLENFGSKVNTFVIEGGQHRVTSHGAFCACDFIKNHSIKKIAI